MTLKEAALPEIDDELLIAVGKGEIMYPKGTAEYYVVQMLNDAARDLGAANLAFKEAQKQMTIAQRQAAKAEAQREAAAKLLTAIYRGQQDKDKAPDSHQQPA